MPFRGPVALGASGLVCAAVIASALGSAPLSARADSGPRALYVNEVLSGIAHASVVAPTDPQSEVDVGVMISHPQQAAEDRYIHDEYTRGTAAYGHWLSPAEYQARFGVSSESQVAVAEWLHSGGLQVTVIPGATDYLLASGTAARVGDLLDVRFNQVRSTAGVVRANDRAPSAPASLHIFGFTGLDTLQGPHLNRFSPANRPAVSAIPAQHRALGPNTNTGLSTPQVLWDVYAQPAVNRGEGQTMAIFGWGVTDGVERDLRFEEREFKLPATPFSATHYGTEKITDINGLGEWDLDTQSSTGMAPNTQGIKLYFGNAGSDPDLIAAYKAWVADPQGPLQGSSSFGGCEQAPGTENFAGGPGNPQGVLIVANASQDLYDAALKQAVAEGRTMFASTGDTGSSCPAVQPLTLNGITNEAVPLLGYPAASAYAVAVGGTVLYYDGDGSAASPAARALEYAWPYTGGGSSAFIKAPDFQSGVATIVGHCISDGHGSPYSPAAPLCRGIPDISAQSGDFHVGTGLLPNGYTITTGGSTDQPGGGTSLSSPLWLGMWTRIQAASATGTGFANAQIYAMGTDSAKGANDFYDIVAGGNGYYAATPGWDYVSGFGTPQITSLMRDIDKGNILPVHPVPPPPVVVSIPPLPLHTNPCDHLFVGTAGHDSLQGTPALQGMDPQLNILAGDITLSADGRYLVSTLTINDLSKTLPPGGQMNQYYMDWTYKGTAWYSVVQVDSAGTVTFNDGYTGSVGSNRPGRTTRAAADTGRFTPGPNGTVVVNVPVSAVGNPRPGDLLSAPTGTAQEQEGVILPSYDTAGPNFDYLVGDVCRQSKPGPVGGVHLPDSAAVGGLANTAGAGSSLLLPAIAAGGLLLAATATGRRRRRSGI